MILTLSMWNITDYTGKCTESAFSDFSVQYLRTRPGQVGPEFKMRPRLSKETEDGIQHQDQPQVL